MEVRMWWLVVAVVVVLVAGGLIGAVLSARDKALAERAAAERRELAMRLGHASMLGQDDGKEGDRT
jgi:hypothetical protein